LLSSGRGNGKRCAKHGFDKWSAIQFHGRRFQ
jgi:hypothetical protein